MILYRHIRLDTNIPFYIGIGKHESRAYSKFGRNSRWNNIAKKHGYRVEIIFDDLTKEEACKKEIEFIQLYGRLCKNEGFLCNISAGGEMVCGDENPMFDIGVNINIDGITYSSIATAARFLDLHVKTITYRLNSPHFLNYVKVGQSKDFVEKINVMKERKHTEESKLKMSLRKKGKSLIVKDKHAAILNRKNRVPVILEKDNNAIEFISISVAAKFLGVASSSIKRALQNNRKCKAYAVNLKSLKNGQK